jgi:hypothetical protein
MAIITYMSHSIINMKIIEVDYKQPFYENA